MIIVNIARSPPGLSSHSPGNSMVGSPPARAMDDLSDCFAGSFTVTNSANDTNRPHPRFAMYKMKNSSSNQVDFPGACKIIIETDYFRNKGDRGCWIIKKPKEMI